MRYQIETRNEELWHSREWSPDVGGPNEFGTEAEAEAVIEELRKLGEDWAAAEYRVVEAPA